MTTRKAQPAPEPDLFTVTLLAAHTHAGSEHAAGAKIQVNAADRQWLIEHGVIATPDQE